MTAIVIFITYDIFCGFFHKEWTHSQYNYQANVIKADEYLYNSKIPEAVILGSSLSSRIVTDSLPGYYNLAMYGMGVFDGMNILLKKKVIPHLIFIEVNYFYKPPNENFKKIFGNSTMEFLKQKLPVLRDENQPMGLSYGIIKNYLGGNKKIYGTHRLDTALFQAFLSVLKKAYSRPDTTSINKAVPELRAFVNELSKRGSEVYFFEMPINYELTMMPASKAIRDIIRKNFGKSVFIQIPGEKFITMDGVHLGEQEALEYTQYLKGKLPNVSAAN